VVFVSHLHPDHLDEAAIQLIDKSTPVICPNTIVETIVSYGFKNILEIATQLTFAGINLHLTGGHHGTGEIEEKMGQVNGLVFQHQNNSVYVVGDSLWCPEVKEAIDSYQPKHIILAGGAATFTIGESVTMTAADCLKVAKYARNATLWITHLESISPCREDRNFLGSFIRSNGLQDQCKILADGEEVHLK
jgi:L-ascorbate metabolism protein UlaG (beta-lactamase superfamily)